jgi:hypothetical protein
LGHATGTWTNQNGKTFFDYIKDNPQIGKQVNIFAFGYPSNIIKAGSFDINDASNRLNESLKFHQVYDGKTKVVFVAHSMGGLVVLRHMLNERERMPVVPLIVLLATPTEGAQIAAIAKHVLKNSALSNMDPANHNALLRQLNDDWVNVSAEVRPKLRCAYEKRPTSGVMIVPWESASRMCSEQSTIPVNANHLDIAKPDSPSHDSVVVLVNALNELVMGAQIQGKLETPDFQSDNGRYSFTLNDPLGKSDARLVNTGKLDITYTVIGRHDNSLHVWPADTPRPIPGQKTELMSFALGIGAKQREYPMSLQYDASGTIKTIDVTVKVPDLNRVVTEQRAVIEAATENAQTALSANPDSAVAKDVMIESVFKTVSARNPKLPPEANWVISAEVMGALNWPGLAGQALRNAEQVSPATARMPSVQRLAAVTAAQSGVPKIFKNNPTREATADEISARQLPPGKLSPAAISKADALAAEMQKHAPLKGAGLSLKADVARQRGDARTASDALVEASKIAPSPSISQRLAVVDPAASAKLSAANLKTLTPGK